MADILLLEICTIFYLFNTIGNQLFLPKPSLKVLHGNFHDKNSLSLLTRFIYMIIQSKSNNT